MSRVKKARQRAIRNAVERDMTAEDRLREQMAANQMLARVYTVHPHVGEQGCVWGHQLSGCQVHDGSLEGIDIETIYTQ